ncbi:MAG: hypothetical protein QOJ97_124 [Solirubrobacteraceae bacterium]|jgi:hypothetical protein|nr:hypothetical protein [Solirubrobacteraceae bacterium]
MSSEEEQLRAQLEEEMRRITVDDLLVQTVVSLINLAGRKIGLAPGTEGERDPAQVKTAIDAVQALLPLLEREGGEAIKPIRDALAQLQMAYAREAAGEAPGEPPAPGSPSEPPPPAEPEGGGPAQSSGRLWIPGQ